MRAAAGRGLPGTPAAGSAGGEAETRTRPQACRLHTARNAAQRTAARSHPQPPADPTETAPTVQIVQPPATNTFAAARALLLSGKFQEAIAVLRALNDDGNPDVAASIGYAYGRIGRLGDAKAWYDKALATNPDHVWALAYTGIWRVEQGDVPNAQRDLEKVAALCGGTGCIAYRELAEAIARKSP